MEKINQVLNYKTFGEGKPLVILHGLFGSLDNWQTIGKKWAEHYQVILVDLPNHGKSYHTSIFSYEQMAEAVAYLCDELSLSKIILLGHSMGGKTAMTFAVNFPEKLEKLIVVDIAPKAYAPHHDEILEGLHSIDLKLLTSRNEADEILKKTISNVGVRLFLLKNLARENEGYVWKMNLPLLSSAVNQVIENTPIDYPIGIPTLFIRGALSNYIVDSDFNAIYDKFPNATIETIEHAGHWVHAEQPEELENKVIAFIN